MCKRHAIGLGALLFLVLILALPGFSEAGYSATGTGGCVATAAAPSITEGAPAQASCDLNANGRVTLGTCFGGDSHCVSTDPDSYLRVRTHTTPSARVTSDTQIKASAGWVSHLTCMPTDAAATAGTIIVYDSLTETGTVLQQFDVQAFAYVYPIVLPIMAVASTGIYLGFTTTADMACTVFYK